MAQRKITYFSHVIGRFDREEGVIRGVSVITEGTAKGHDLVVDSQTLMEVKRAAENSPSGRLKCKLNHKSGVDAVFGYLSDFRIEGPKLLGDLHMLKSHDKFDQTWEQLETLPDEIGLSIAFVAPKSAKGGKTARCEEILSADLVPEPAANPTGLFETKVDSETNHIMADENQNTNAGNGVSNEQIMDFLQNQLMPRLDAVEAFQNAIQAELEQADNLEEGDDGNGDAEGGEGDFRGEGDNGNGGTDQNGGRSLQESMTGMPAAVAAEFSALKNAVIMLQRKDADQADADRQLQFEQATEIIKAKSAAVIEFAKEVMIENEALHSVINTGVAPVKATPENIFLEANRQNGKFEQLVHDFMAKNPKAKRSEAVTFAVKTDPIAHKEFMSRQGVIRL